MKQIILALLIGVLVSGPAIAAKSGTIGHAIELYDKGGSSRSFILSFFTGLEQGVGWSNSLLTATGRKPHYCQPGNLLLNPDQYFTIFRQFAERANYLGLNNAQTGNIFINAMINAYPCKQ
jgi:hypothetical protein